MVVQTMPHIELAASPVGDLFLGLANQFFDFVGGHFGNDGCGNGFEGLPVRVQQFRKLLAQGFELGEAFGACV